MTCCILPNLNIATRVRRDFIEVENINGKTLNNFKNELISRNIYEEMNHDTHANPNENCQILTDIISEAKNIHIPKTTRRFNKRKDKKEKWMTTALLNQINMKNDMYLDWKTKSATIEI